MSSTFSVTRDQCIVEALSICGAYDITNPPGTADYNSVAFTFNCMVKAWILQGMPVWKIQTVLLPLNVGQNLYQIGPYATGTGALVTTKIDRIIYAFIRNTTNNDTPIDQLSFQEYNQYGDKNAQGIVNSMLYQPGTDVASGIDNSTVTTYPVQATAGYNLGLIAQVQLNDFNVGTDVPDFPAECFMGLCYSLADLISLKYATSMDRINKIEAKAKIMYDAMVDWSQENTDSIRFMYDRRGGTW